MEWTVGKGGSATLANHDLRNWEVQFKIRPAKAQAISCFVNF